MNVLDHLKSESVEAIKNYCAENCINAAVAMTHVHGDFNLSTVLRNANFFGFKEAFYIEGKKSYDKRAAVGTYNYTPMTYCQTQEDFWGKIQGKYTPIALENNVNYRIENIFDYVWPENPIIVVGEEQAGLTNDILDKCAGIVSIPAFGSVRSINVGTAAGIAMSLIRRQLHCLA
jgi:tRNA G18 (ribose-2'-O)-methylase SpoU